MYLLMQRLLRTNNDGNKVNYDYMGSAEFEFGATQLPRAELAILECTEKKINMIVHRYKYHQPSDRGLLAEGITIRYPLKYEEEYPEQVAAVIKTLETGNYSLKESLYSTDPKRLVAWMMIQPMPMIVFGDKDRPLVEWFLNDFKRQIQEAHKEDGKSELEIVIEMQKKSKGSFREFWIRPTSTTIIATV